MDSYTFYFINQRGFTEGEPINFDANTDVEALHEARRIQAGKDVEVREGFRVVAYLVPDSIWWPSGC